MSARFTTITGDVWRLSLAASRIRRKGAPERIARSIRLAAQAADKQLTSLQKPC